MRRAALLVTMVMGCTHAQAPHARRIGAAMSVTGVGGLIGASLTNNLTDHTGEILAVSSVVSLVGMLVFAGGDLAQPTEQGETLSQRNHRWARILSERASGAARDGRCPRVRRLAVRIRGYDREVHDFVLMRDPEVIKCLTVPEATPADHAP